MCIAYIPYPLSHSTSTSSQSHTCHTVPPTTPASTTAHHSPMHTHPHPIYYRAIVYSTIYGYLIYLSVCPHVAYYPTLPLHLYTIINANAITGLCGMAPDVLSIALLSPMPNTHS